MLGRPSADQTEYFTAGATLSKKNRTNNKKRRNKTPKP
jgi:hypothetical protein